MEDRISVLPDEVIHHIFSFMRIPAVIHTSILSNRWKHLWLSTPALKFNYDIFYCDCLGSTCNMCREMRIRHVNFVNRVLITRQSNLVKFQMSNNGSQVDANHILTWIIGVLGLHAQEIILCCASDDILQLPHHLFNPNIRVLELDFVGKLIPLPNSVSRAIRLTSLVLNNVYFPNGSADGEFILSCPVLENLKMCSCYLGNLSVLTVSTPLLKRLDFWSLYTMGNVSCKVKTSAPSLSSFDVSISAPMGCCSVDFCVEDLVSLVSASISFYFEKENEHAVKHMLSHPLIDILTGFHNVQVLEVSNRLIQVITSIPKLLKRLPKLLKNLRSLMVMDEYESHVPEKVCKVQEAVIFLEQLPHVETLVWERTYMHYWLYKDDVWEATTQYQGIFSCLKSFEFRNFLGFDAEQKFLEFLLARATVLEELIIKTPSLALVDGTKLARYKENLSLYGDKLSSLPRSSSSVTISYKIKS